MISFKGHRYLPLRTSSSLGQIPSWEYIWEEVQSIKGVDSPDDATYYRDIYDQTVEALLEFAGRDVWRALVIPEDVDPTSIDDLGVYWADNQYSVDAVWSERYDEHWEGRGPGREVVYRARVDDISAIDAWGTVEARTTFEGVDDDEIRLLGGSTVHVYDVTLQDGTVLEVNDWRTT